MITIQLILLFFLTATISIAIIDSQSIDQSTKTTIYSSILFVLGGLGFLTLPSLYTQLDSPYYIIFAISIAIALLYLGYKQFNNDTPLEIIPKLSYATISTIGIYFLGVYVPPIRKILIELVTTHTVTLLESLSFDLTVTTGPDYGYLSEYRYATNGTTYATYINIACTGIGAFSIVSGLISLASTTTKRKVQLWIISGLVIYVLNIARNVFVSYAFFTDSFSYIPQQLVAPHEPNPNLTSFVVAEVYISQLLSSAILFLIFVWIYERTNLFDELESQIQNI